MNPYLSAFLSLFYPPTCAVCDEALVTGEECICTRCLYNLPYYHASLADLELKFADECRIGPMHALLHYHRESPYRELVRDIKYRENKRLAIYLGKLFGEKLKGKVAADMIIPLPLHPRRQRARGFNQSTRIARGIASVMQLPVREGLIRRVINNPTQTKLNPAERAMNATGLFAVTNPGALEGKHILLVDDVVTTGATIASCLKELGPIPGIRVSVVCLARAGLP
ncbi:MAG: ComF family protein [Odoribacteraceae bacterium]|jgi:ComF family protein|nr:ComF family protein [Odoribacteraceae bacterium]